MRKTLTALLFAATLPTLAMAATQAPSDVQPPPAGAPMMDGHGGKHFGHGGPMRELNLTQEQREQIGKLMGDSMKSRHEITEKYFNKLPAAERKAMQDELKANRDKTDQSIRGLLTPDQQKKFDEIKAKREQRKAEWAAKQKAPADAKTN